MPDYRWRWKYIAAVACLSATITVHRLSSVGKAVYLPISDVEDELHAEKTVESSSEMQDRGRYRTSTAIRVENTRRASALAQADVFRLPFCILMWYRARKSSEFVLISRGCGTVDKCWYACMWRARVKRVMWCSAGDAAVVIFNLPTWELCNTKTTFLHSFSMCERGVKTTVLVVLFGYWADEVWVRQREASSPERRTPAVAQAYDS
jgi:hypothetical protein